MLYVTKLVAHQGLGALILQFYLKKGLIDIITIYIVFSNTYGGIKDLPRFNIRSLYGHINLILGSHEFIL